MITVTCRKRDPKCTTTPKYENLSDFDVTPENPNLPNGVHGYRYLRQISPDVSRLSPLAEWLAEQCEGRTFAGRMPAAQFDRRIRCYAGITQRDLVIHQAETNANVGTTKYRNPETGEPDFERAKTVAAGHIKMWSLDLPEYNSEVRIDDFLVPIIEPEQDDTDYWNLVAEQIVAGGAVRVQIGAFGYLIDTPAPEFAYAASTGERLTYRRAS
jgi:hypothetical protein